MIYRSIYHCATVHYEGDCIMIAKGKGVRVEILIHFAVTMAWQTLVAAAGNVAFIFQLKYHINTRTHSHTHSHTRELHSHGRDRWRRVIFCLFINSPAALRLVNECGAQRGSIKNIIRIKFIYIPPNKRINSHTHTHRNRRRKLKRNRPKTKVKHQLQKCQMNSAQKPLSNNSTNKHDNDKKQQHGETQRGYNSFNPCLTNKASQYPSRAQPAQPSRAELYRKNETFLRRLKTVRKKMGLKGKLTKLFPLTIRSIGGRFVGLSTPHRQLTLTRKHRIIDSLSSWRIPMKMAMIGCF